VLQKIYRASENDDQRYYVERSVATEAQSTLLKRVTCTAYCG